MYCLVLSTITAEKSWQHLLVRMLNRSFDVQYFILQTIGITV